MAEIGALWSELVALLEHRAWNTVDVDERLVLLREVAQLCEEKLDDSHRAFVNLQAILVSTERRTEVFDELAQLSQATGRVEDILILLECETTPAFELSHRKQVLCRRAEICEQRVEQPLRAFHEYRRCLELDPSDWSSLEKLREVASAHDRWPELDAAYGEILDRTEDRDLRLQLIAGREDIARNHLGDQALAFRYALRRYRFDPHNVELLRQLLADAAQLKAWEWLLPLLEASQLAVVGPESAEELTITGALYEEKLGELDRAFALYREVFVLDPESTEVRAKIEQLAEATGRYEQLADALRLVAATSESQVVTLDLLRSIAAIYEHKNQLARTRHRNPSTHSRSPSQ